MRSPVAVPCVRLADGAAALHTDRGHSLPSLFLPLAALGSLPKLSHVRVYVNYYKVTACGSFIRSPVVILDIFLAANAASSSADHATRFVEVQDATLHFL